MKNILLSAQDLDNYHQYLKNDEKSSITIDKYMRDVGYFINYIGNRPISKDLVLEYKACLVNEGYAVRSVNSMLAALNSFLTFLGISDYKVKFLKYQRQTYCSEDKELTKAEYHRLLRAAKKYTQLNLILQTICSTGIRVSELKYFTVECVKRGDILVCSKNKNREILIPGKLRRLLLEFAKRHRIFSGPIFVGRSGKPLNRSNIWRSMKTLCSEANVNPSKVFPHNLRKLFARTFYGIEKDIAKLADLLGHSSIDTTRIYIMTTSYEHRKKLEQLGLVV